MILRDLIIQPEAEQDAAEAYTWYEQSSSGLGEEFLRCVDACIQSIRRNLNDERNDKLAKWDAPRLGC